MQNLKIGVMFFVSVILASACASFTNPGTEYILNVDNEFEIEINEKLGENSRSVEFTITSLDKQQCQETALELVSKTTLNSLNIEIANIILPAECGVKGSYPVGSAFFNVAERAYELQIDIQDIVQHKGSLEVTPNSYELSLSGDKGLVLVTDVIQKIPEKFVWGYYQISSSNEYEVLSRFFADNELYVQPLTYMEPGHYSYFDIDAQGNIIIEDIPSGSAVLPFAFSEIEINELKEATDVLKKDHSTLDLNFFASDGSAF